MSTERPVEPRIALLALLVVCWLFVAAIAAMFVFSEYQILRYGEGKFGGIHRAPALVLVVYYGLAGPTVTSDGTEYDVCAPEGASILEAQLRRIVATVVALVLLTGSLAATAQVIQQRVVNVNGRTVQEIRFGNEPGSPTRLRIVVITNGPTAGTTSLLTAVADVNDWVNPSAPAPTFTPIIASGTVFSVGGGCTRGGQVDFPFINANEPRVLRFSGGTPTAASFTSPPALQ